MKAVLVSEPGAELRLGNVPDPVPGSGELLVRVRASGLNRADLEQRRGRYPPPPGASEILGLEVAGEVIGWGEGVTGWQQGERVMALLPGGGYAEQATLPAGLAMRIPERLNFVEAAAIPEVWLTAYLNLFGLGRLTAGQVVLVHAGGSGVGTAALQLIREVGARAISTSSASKCARCAALGADPPIDYATGPFAPAVLEATGGKGVALILDFIGAPYLTQNLEVLATEGRMIVIGLLGGRLGEINLGLVLAKRAQIMGTALRPQPLERKLALTAEFAEFALPRFAAGRLRPLVDRVFPLDQAAGAHQYMESNRNFGKIILQVE